MKTFILFLLFLWLYIPVSYSQIIEDTIFIKFNKETDLIKKDKEGNTNIWLNNILYEEELIQYKKKMKQYKKDTLPPPSIFFPVKPYQYYKYFMTGKPQLCKKFTKTHFKNLCFFDRRKLRTLDPYKKLIFVVKGKKDSIFCLPVSFYKNVRE